MIAKIIAHGRDRDEAISRLHRALSQMTVLVRGGTTNKSFLLDLLDRPEVRAGAIDTSWLDRLTAADEHLPTRLGDVALVAAVLDAGDLPGRARPGRVPRLGQPRPAPGRRAGRARDRAAPRRPVVPDRTAAHRPDPVGGRARRHRRHGRRRAPRSRSQPVVDRRSDVLGRVVGAGERPPHRGRRRRPPLLPRRRRHRAGAGGGARRRRRRGPRRHRRDRRAARRGRGDEDGDRRPVPGRRTGARRLRHPQHAGRRRGPAVPHRAGRRRRRCRAGRRPHRPRRAAGRHRAGRSRRRRPPARRRGLRARASTSTPATGPPPARRGVPRPAGRRGRGAGDPRRLRRPRGRRARAARRRRRRDPGPARVLQHATCARSTSSARGCRSGSATACGGPSPTTA